MDYREINDRIKEIKKEIYELGQQSTFDINEKIEALKLINILLREQNQLLAIKQNQVFAA